MAFWLLAGVYFQPNINCLFVFCRSKKGLKVPPYHFVDHKLDLLSHNIDGAAKEEFEQREIAHAHLSNLPVPVA